MLSYLAGLLLVPPPIRRSIWLSDNKVQINWVVVFEGKFLKIETKYAKVLQGFILSQMKLVAARRIYFHGKYHFNNRKSPVNRVQKQSLEIILWKNFPRLSKNNRKPKQNTWKLLVNEFIFTTVAHLLRNSYWKVFWKIGRCSETCSQIFDKYLWGSSFLVKLQAFSLDLEAYLQASSLTLL